MTGPKDGGNYSCLVRNDSHAYMHNVALSVIGNFIHLIRSVLSLPAFRRGDAPPLGRGKSCRDQPGVTGERREQPGKQLGLLVPRDRNRRRSGWDEFERAIAGVGLAKPFQAPFVEARLFYWR